MENKIDTSSKDGAVIKSVKASGNTGRVYVPKPWVGKRVKISLYDEENE